MALPTFARVFKVFHNTLDPSEFGTIGGLRLNETGEGYVTAFTMCLRFQGQYSKKPFYISIIWKTD